MFSFILKYRVSFTVSYMHFLLSHISIRIQLHKETKEYFTFIRKRIAEV